VDGGLDVGILLIAEEAAPGLDDGGGGGGGAGVELLEEVFDCFWEQLVSFPENGDVVMEGARLYM